MTEQLVNGLVSPSATLVTASIAAGTTTTFTVAWVEPTPPTAGTYTLLFKGAADDGSDDSLFRVATMSSATVIATGSWEKVGAQATFAVGAEMELDHSKASVNAVIADHSAATDPHADRAYADTGDALKLAKASNLSDLASAATARTNLGLGTAALVADAGLLHTTGAESKAGALTLTSALGLAAGSAAAPAAARSTDLDTGTYFPTGNQFAVATGGTQAALFSDSAVTIPSTRNLIASGGLLVNNRLALAMRAPTMIDLGGDSDPQLDADITSTTALSFTVDDSTLFDNDVVPFSALVDTEWMVCTALVGNTLTVVRGRFGTAAATHTTGANVFDRDFAATNFNNFVIATTSSPVTNFSETSLNGNITIYLPPKATVGSWAKPTGKFIYQVAFLDIDTYTVTLMTGDGTTVTAQTGTGSPCRLAISVQYDTVLSTYVPLSLFLG